MTHARSLWAAGAAAVFCSATMVRAAEVAAAGGDDMICHTTDVAECYPRVFVPTHDFQPVHEDQSLPPGLHVRLNINTGEREAKIYDPSEDAPAELEGLPVERSVVVVDEGHVESENKNDKPTIPKGAPAYDADGIVKEPPPDDSIVGPGFAESLAVVKGALGDPAAFSTALEQLETYAHDLYYGLQLAQDPVAVHRLLCLATGSVDASSPAMAQEAGAVLGSAINNHRKALDQIEAQWPTLKADKCGAGVFALYEPFLASPALARARLSVVGGLIRSRAIAAEFVAADGLAEVLRVLVAEPAAGADATDSVAHERVRRRAAQVVSDVFLDESMNAQTDLWPAQDTAASCSDGVSASCWNHEVERLAKKHAANASHWSHELWTMLQARDLAKSKDEL